MRVTAQLKIISSLTIVALVVLAPILVLSFVEFKSARKDYILADALKVTFFESASFRDQYFLYREDRAHKLFDKSNDSLNNLLNQANIQFRGDESRKLLQHLRRNIEDSAIIFHRITDNTAAFKTATDNREIYSELDRRLFSQLLLKATAARDEATSLKDASANRVERTYKHLAIIIGLFALTLALATILTAAHLGRLIRKRLASLHDGAKIVADGNLNYRIAMQGADEFSELAASINAMTDKLNEEIMERQKREDQLAESESRFREIFNAVNEAIFIHDAETGRIMDVNRRMLEMYGLSREQALVYGHDDLSAATPPYSSAEAAEKIRLTSVEGPQTFDWLARAGDGRLFWVEVSLRLAHIGNQQRVLAVVRDITERKQAEIALRDSEAFVNAILNSVPNEIAVLDSSGIIVATNNSWQNFALENSAEPGNPAAHTEIGSNYLDASRAGTEVSPDNGMNAHDGIRAVLEGRLPTFSLEYPCHSPHQQRWFSMCVSTLEFKWRGVVISHTDITERKRAELDLQMESEKNLALLRNASDGIHILDMQGNVIEASDSFCAMLGYTRAEAIGMNVAQWDAQFSDAERSDKIREQFALQQRSLFETRHRRKDGGIFDVEVSGFPLELGGQPVLFNSSRDITKRKAAKAKLQQSEARMRAILDNVPYLIWMKDVEGRFMAINKAFFRTTGLKKMQDVLGKTDTDLWPEHLAQKYRADDADVLSTRKQKLTEEMSMDNGEAHWVETFKAPIMDMEGNLLGTTGFAQDITIRKNAEGKIRHLAHYDPLTDLPNRTLFSDRLQQALAAAKRDKAHMALMFIDLDKFKPINDELGHHVGDLLLKEVAKRMQDCMRESDTVARIGGDEFVVLLPVIEAEQDAMLVAEKIREELNRPFVLVGRSLSISSSTGIAVYPEHGKDETQLMKNADVAMYHAKQGGRNSVMLYQTDMRDT